MGRMAFRVSHPFGARCAGALAGASCCSPSASHWGSDLSTTLGRVTGAGPLLVCFDGSAGAEHAIDVAAVLAPGRAAIVLRLAAEEGHRGRL